MLSIGNSSFLSLIRARCQENPTGSVKKPLQRHDEARGFRKILQGPSAVCFSNVSPLTSHLLNTTSGARATRTIARHRPRGPSLTADRKPPRSHHPFRPPSPNL